MKTLTLATDLTNINTNIQVKTNQELSNIIKLVGAYNVYISTPLGWESLGHFMESNNVFDIL